MCGDDDNQKWCFYAFIILRPMWPCDHCRSHHLPSPGLPFLHSPPAPKGYTYWRAAPCQGLLLLVWEPTSIGQHPYGTFATSVPVLWAYHQCYPIRLGPSVIYFSYGIIWLMFNFLGFCYSVICRFIRIFFKKLSPSSYCIHITVTVQALSHQFGEKSFWLTYGRIK